MADSMGTSNTENTRLWLLNDEGMYNDLLRYKRKYGAKLGANAFYDIQKQNNCLTMPDGTVMTKTGIREAMSAL